MTAPITAPNPAAIVTNQIQRTRGCSSLPTLDQLVAVCPIAPNLENVLQLLVRERMQVWPYLVVLTVAFILFQPLCNRIVGMHWCA